MTLLDGLHRLAHDTVAWFLEEWAPRPDDNAALEAAEVVEVDSDGPGVMLLWIQTTYDQGQRKSGFLMSVRELLIERTAPSEKPRWATRSLPDLTLAVVEPHRTPVPPGVRAWFPHIP